MPRSALTGSRIRARRLDLGLRQSDLAEICGISASYLNLIEHNRRRIGGKLLIDLARALDVEVSTLAEGADVALLEALRAAARRDGAAEDERIEEFAGRFPGWSRLVVRQEARIASLEQAVATLADRLAHDPYLSASIHEILSAAAAIRSTSAILVEEKDVDPVWQARFHRNLHEDSRRLADASRTLVTYLDAGGDASKSVQSPQEEFDVWLDRIDCYVGEIEAGFDPGDAALLETASELTTEPARSLATAYLAQYRTDAVRMPAERFLAAVAEHGPDPTALANAFEANYPAVFRRLAALAGRAKRAIGLVVCDGAGAVLFRREIDGFSVPRFSAACPLWPLFEALARPMTPIRSLATLPGPVERRFEVLAIAEPRYSDGFDGPAVFRSYMLISPAPPGSEASPARSVGSSCRVCPRPDCAARREAPVVGSAA